MTAATIGSAQRSCSSALQGRFTSLLLALYLAGGLFFAVRLAGGWRLARRLVAGATPCRRRSIGSRVLESPAVATPLTTGVVSPSVLLPMTWREWPADKLAAVLAHENAHIVRRDALVAFLAQINRAIFWFHPLAWWLERTLAVTAEHACDEAAARQIGQPRRYAEVLLDMAEAVSVRGQRVSWQTIGVDGSGLLGARIDRILKGDALARMSGARRDGCGGRLCRGPRSRRSPVGSRSPPSRCARIRRSRSRSTTTRRAASDTRRPWR